MRALFTFWLFCVCLLVSLFAVAQEPPRIVAPTFGTRGEVPEDLVETFMTSFRRQLRIETGLEIDPGELITEGIAASLEPKFVGIIAELGGGRYGISGEIAEASVPTSSAPFVVTMLVGDRQLGRSSDLLSQPLEAGDVRRSALMLARLVKDFLNPADALSKGTASIYINSQPGEAQISVNGVVVGMTPQILENLAAGRVEVELRKEGYLPTTESVVLEAGQMVFVNPILTPITGGSIQVTSEPAARVFLDGEFVGTTPLAVQALPGIRTVRLERAGFTPEVLSVLVRNFWVSRVEESLEPTLEPLLYWNAPPGTLVSVDGVLRPDGYAAELAAGAHQVEVRYGLERAQFSIVIPESGVYLLDLEEGRLVPNR